MATSSQFLDMAHVARLPALPSELVLEIANRLPSLSKLALFSTTRRFYSLLQLSRREKLDILLSLGRKGPVWVKPGYVVEELYRPCSHCMQLLPFYHFSRGNASRKWYPRRLRCMDCWSVQFGRPGSRMR